MFVGKRVLDIFEVDFILVNFSNLVHILKFLRFKETKIVDESKPKPMLD